MHRFSLRSARIAAMQFLYDLDGLTVLLTGLSIALVCIILALLWTSYEGRWPKESGGVLGLLLLLTGFCSVHAYTAYCPDADQPHIRRTGILNPFKAYKYPVGKSSHGEGILECVGPCGKGVPLMEFNQGLTWSVAREYASVPLTVTFLGRMEQADIWNGYRITAHPVVEIDDESGERIFYVDTTRHWPRVIVLLADGFLCICTFVFCLTRAESGTSQNDSSSDQRRSVPIPNTLTGLGLDSDDQAKS